MTKNKKFKHQVRARASKTGESYTAALQHFTGVSASPVVAADTLRIAAAQLPSPVGRGAGAAIGAVGAMIRGLMREARDHGAALIHFGEGALCAPGKRIMSHDRLVIAESDWSRFGWDAQSQELRLIAAEAAELRVWTVVGAVHRRSAPGRPHNSLYVFDDRGEMAIRYDERMLSSTKAEFMYAPGERGVVFDVRGVRFGCALGMESVYPELFIEYERRDVDCVLFSSHGPNRAFALQVQGHASSNCFWVSYATSCGATPEDPASGIAGPDGDWSARCPHSNEPAIAVTDVAGAGDNLARPWRRRARANLQAALGPAPDGPAGR